MMQNEWTAEAYKALKAKRSGLSIAAWEKMQSLKIVTYLREECERGIIKIGTSEWNDEIEKIVEDYDVIREWIEWERASATRRTELSDAESLTNEIDVDVILPLDRERLQLIADYTARGFMFLEDVRAFREATFGKADKVLSIEQADEFLGVHKPFAKQSMMFRRQDGSMDMAQLDEEKTNALFPLVLSLTQKGNMNSADVLWVICTGTLFPSAVSALEFSLEILERPYGAEGMIALQVPLWISPESVKQIFAMCQWHCKETKPRKETKPSQMKPHRPIQEKSLDLFRFVMERSSIPLDKLDNRDTLLSEWAELNPQRKLYPTNFSRDVHRIKHELFPSPEKIVQMLPFPVEIAESEDTANKMALEIIGKQMEAKRLLMANNEGITPKKTDTE